MDAYQKMIYLPDIMINWPWPRAINPHFEDVKIEADASFRDFKALSPESQEAFEKCDFARLVALAYPNAPREHIRIGCDLMNVFFLLEEYTDTENGTVTKEMVDIVIDALHNPHKIRPEGESILGEIARQFWARAIQTASLPSQRHFLETFTAYLRAVVVEALDRERSHRRSINDYLKLRRLTVGAVPSFVICEMGMDLPDEVFYHPVVVELAECSTDLILISNDMVSYNKEQAAGSDDHNFISVVMLELGLDRGGAIAWAARYHAELQKRFIDGLAKVPSWGPSVDILVKEFLDGIANWPRADNCWSFEGQRYFGTRGPEIRQTRLVPLLPKANRKAAA
ncbi:isoprenoid synthase domain-containing protein [Suillus clintonianus]|uniref:isoprenoid synthase domain-containing protein n=1 Tax=Suillus clintonianus TaxID=1904413 RepID=UPI001B85BA42|nr:isoprenoid synthase domain-containing protein [Suillus clintonianus]KAG2118311.1 isoprenoid synthase domain-containing protein [Suillus clintonianus]